MSADASKPALPAGWTEHTAPTGHAYYYHAESGTSTYDRPDASTQVSVPPPPPPPPDFPEGEENGEAAAAATDAVMGEPNGQAEAGAGAGADEPEEAARTTKKDKKPKKDKKKKEKPVDKLPIEGTPWIRVVTDAGNVFFNNRATLASVWTVPEEIAQQVEAALAARERQQQAAARAKHEAETRQARLLQEKEEEMQRLREELEREREASKKRKLEEDEQAAQADAESSKRARQSVQVEDDGAVGERQDGHEVEDAEEQPEAEAEPELEEWEKDELRKKAELEAELVEEAPAPAPVEEKQETFSSDEAIALFKTMLAEKDINPMKPWDMELPKFINDSRYKAVKQLRERRDLFDEFCKLKIRENRAKKAANGAAAKVDPASAYRALLMAEVMSTRAHWADFRNKHKKEARFRDFGRDDRERERVFRNWLRELGEIKRADAQKAEGKFTEMLEEHFARSGVTPAEEARWSDVKGQLSKDPRYGVVASSSQREEVFKRFIKQRADAAASQSAESKVDPEEGARKAAEDRKARQAASLKEREEKVRREREAQDRLAGRSKAEAGREESEREYKNLLIDAVRDHEAKWSDVLPSFGKDPRFTSSSLPLAQKRRLFDEHLDSIYHKRINALETLFAQHSPKLQTPFEDVYASISSDPHLTRLGLSMSRVERLHEDWQRRRLAQAKKDFETLLNESSFVDYWGKLKQEHTSKEDDRAKGLLGPGENDNDEEDEAPEDEAVDLRAMAAQIDLKELHAVLKHDKRYAIFEYDPAMREEMLREHVDQLSRPKKTVHQH